MQQWDKVKELWTEWRPTQAEAAIWRAELNKYDPALANRAISQLYKETGRFRKPDIGRLEPLMNKISLATKQPTNTRLFYIGLICSEAGDKQAGYYEQYSWLATWDTLTTSYQVPASEYLARHCDHYQQIHKGRWVSVLTDDYRDVRNKAREYGDGMAIEPAKANVRQPGQPDKYTAAGHRKGTPKTRAITEDMRHRQMLALQATTLEEKLAEKEGREPRTTEDLLPDYRRKKPAKLPPGVTTLGTALKHDPNRIMEDDEIKF